MLRLRRALAARQHLWAQAHVLPDLQAGDRLVQALRARVARNSLSRAGVRESGRNRRMSPVPWRA